MEVHMLVSAACNVLVIGIDKIPLVWPLQSVCAARNWDTRNCDLSVWDIYLVDIVSKYMKVNFEVIMDRKW
jgi:hypothetical protein